MTPGMILSLFQVLVALANNVAGYLKDEQMLSAGEAIGNEKNLRRALESVAKAQAARDAIDAHLRADPLWVPPSDPNARD